MFNWSDKTYKWVKWSVLLLIPTLGLAYQKLGAIWGFPLIEQVKATIDIVVYCLAVILGINCAEYDSTKAKLQKALDSVEVKAVEKPKIVIEPKATEVTEVTEVKPTEADPSLPKATEAFTQEVDNGSQGIGGTCICEQGKSYILTCNVKVRESYGTDARWLRRDELTEDGKAHSIEGEYAVLAEGTEVYCQEVYYNWIHIPSGWICARDVDGTDNVKVEDSHPCYPVDYLGFATYYSYNHPAIDFGYSDNPNMPILAPCDMQIVDSGWDDVVGYYVRAYCTVNGNPYTLRFIHMASITVGSGSVGKRTQIGVMGNTGSSSGGTHLHFDVWNGHIGFPSPHDYRVQVSVNPCDFCWCDRRYQSVGDVTAATYPIKYM